MNTVWVVVKVRPGRDDPDEAAGLWEVSLAQSMEPGIAAGAALDIFHGKVAISVLDDFAHPQTAARVSCTCSARNIPNGMRRRVSGCDRRPNRQHRARGQRHGRLMRCQTSKGDGMHCGYATPPRGWPSARAADRTTRRLACTSQHPGHYCS